MFLKKPNLNAITPRLIFWSTLSLTLSLIFVSAITYYLLSTSLKTKDQEYILRLSASVSQSLKHNSLETLKNFESPEVLLMVVDSNGKELYLAMPEYLDQDFEDIEELAQIKAETSVLPLQNGWSTILLISGEEDSDVYHRAEYWFRKKANENEWKNILPLIDNDMFEIYTVQLADGNWLKVGKSFEKTDEYLAAVRKTTFIVLLPFIFFSLIVNFFLARSILSPIKKLAKTITMIKKGDNNLRAEINGSKDEVDLLAEEFNSLIDHNDKLIKNLKSTIDNVAHDLRTPVTRFRTSLEYALLREANVDDLKESLQEGLESSERILELLNAIMDVSEAESQTMKINLEDINLQNFFEQLEDLYQYACEDKNIKLNIMSEPELCVRADRVRLTQALGNLIDNSLKYSQPGTTISITAINSNNKIQISIADQGMGIPAEDLERIWDRLFRGDKSRSSSGLGIGLSVVKAIVQAHSGTITVESNIDRGTTFILSLPSCND